jgi:hypothetical protein
MFSGLLQIALLTGLAPRNAGPKAIMGRGDLLLTSKKIQSAMDSKNQVVIIPTE